MSDNNRGFDTEPICANEIPYDLLADYYYGLTSRESTGGLVEHFESCEHCKTMLQGIKYMSAEVEGREQMEQKLLAASSRLTRIAKKDAQDYPRPVVNMESKRRHVQWMAAALLIGLLGFLARGMFTSQLSMQSQLAIHLSETYPGPQNVRSITIDNEREKLLAQSFELYEAGSFTKAGGNFRELIKSGDTDLRVYFYYGLSSLYQEQSNLEDAVHYLERVAQSQSNYKQQASWLLSLAYAKNQQADKARELWNAIARDSGHYKQAEAAKLLKAHVE